jgi:tetratricopeptide (TPR) repeat protein
MIPIRVPFRSSFAPASGALLALSLLALAGCGPGGGDASGGAGDAAASGTPAWLLEVVNGDPLAEPQATSLLGEALYALPDTTGAVAAADSALLADPDNVDLLIEAGHVRRNLWQYRQGMQLHQRAAELAPNDWRPPRWLGHRYLSLREFDEGIRLLERARELAPLSFDVAYHLGLAYFLAGRFDEAADEYLRCLALADDPEAQAAQAPDFRSCSENGSRAASRVAMTEWAVRALGRAGRMDEARALVAALPRDLEPDANQSYYDNLLEDAGVKTEADLIAGVEMGEYRLETVGYGIATRLLARGDTAAALPLLRELAADPWWPGFGRIAAEVELVRLGEAGRR